LNCDLESLGSIKCVGCTDKRVDRTDVTYYVV